MNILLLDQFSTLGGGQLCLRDLVPGFRDAGWMVRAAVPAGGPLVAQLEAAGAAVHSIPLSAYRNGRKSARDACRYSLESPRIALIVRALVRRFSIDVVYVNGPRLLLPAAASGTRVVFHSHSLLRAGYARLVAGLSLRASGATAIACSRFTAAALQNHVEPRRLRVIYNGVDDLDGGPRPMLRHWPPHIGIVGRISPEKGQLDFIDCARRLVAAGRMVRFTVFGDSQQGDGAYERAVRAAASALPIDFAGWEADRRELYGRLDLLAVPSSEVDATPRVIMEAFSARLPVVAYRSGGIEELIDPMDNGMITAERTGQSLAATILKLLASPDDMHRIGECARATYESRFTLQRFRREVVSALTQCC